jgi:hypothetical protein
MIAQPVPGPAATKKADAHPRFLRVVLGVVGCQFSTFPFFFLGP